MDEKVRALIAELDLSPHPEGGWYRETWRADAAAGKRAAGTAILFLLGPGQRSHWHRVDADELWFWHAGHSLDLLIAESDSSAIAATSLGGDPLTGRQPQCLIPKGYWQSAEARQGWALVSCVVVPGFEFTGFDLAPPDWAPATR